MHRFSAHTLRELFSKGELTAETIVKNTLKRISDCDEKLGAFLKVLSERALEKAQLLDKKRQSGKPLGKLAGVPVALKDNIHIKGEISTCGSKFLENYRAPFDASVVKYLEEEDAILIGKTNMDEFAMGSSTENSAYQLTKNPWDLECSPGGSSGGSAAAVGARLCPISFGSDTGGSIRQPAAFCGIVGFKPTYGRVSRYGLVAFASSLDQIGPFANTVADAALATEVIAKHCPQDSTSLNISSEAYTDKIHHPIHGLKIGVPWQFLEQLTEMSKENFLNAIEVFKELGAQVVDISLDSLKYSVQTYYILATAEASTNLARFDGIRYGKRSSKATHLEEIYNYSRQEGFGSEVKKRILLGTYVLSSGYKDAYYQKAQKIRTLMIQQLKSAFQMCDIIAMPTSPLTTFTLGSIQDPLQMYLQDIFTIAANLAGLPSISVPSGFGAPNRPLGIQLLGAQLEDAKVFQFAHAYEMKTKYTQEISALFDDEITL